MNQEQKNEAERIVDHLLGMQDNIRKAADQMLENFLAISKQRNLRELKMKEIQRRIALNGLPRGDHKVFAAGPVTLQPGSKPYRIVMAKWGDDKISVHQEFFDVKFDAVKDLAFDCSSADSHLENGQYFTVADMAVAQRIFAEKLELHCQYIESCFREAV